MAVGGAMSKVMGGDASAGASLALDGTKWNFLLPLPPNEKLKNIIIKVCGLNPNKDTKKINEILNAIKYSWEEREDRLNSEPLAEFNSVQRETFKGYIEAEGVSSDNADNNKLYY